MGRPDCFCDVDQVGYKDVFDTQPHGKSFKVPYRARVPLDYNAIAEPAAAMTTKGSFSKRA